MLKQQHWGQEGGAIHCVRIHRTCTWRWAKQHRGILEVVVNPQQTWRAKTRRERSVQRQPACSAKESVSAIWPLPSSAALYPSHHSRWLAAGRQTWPGWKWQTAAPRKWARWAGWPWLLGNPSSILWKHEKPHGCSIHCLCIQQNGWPPGKMHGRRWLLCTKWRGRRTSGCSRQCSC